MDAKEKESGLPSPPRPSAGIRFNESCVMIAAFVLALPAMILLLIAGTLDALVSLCFRNAGEGQEQE
ncbi:MAG: hypothetical protein WCB79_06790 [Halobacteriota archaeon]